MGYFVLKQLFYLESGFSHFMFVLLREKTNKKNPNLV